MKLLLFSDLHRDKQAAAALVEKSKQADVIVGAGDFAVCGQGVSDCIDVLRQTKCPAVLVPGNGESIEELKAACQQWPSAHVLHGEMASVDGVNFFGIGGGIPVTPFGDWSWDFTEGQAADLLASCPYDGVLVSHSPPFGCVDVTSRGEHRGSTAVLGAVERCQPRLVVCGHIHDSWEQSAEIGPTRIINAGPSGLLVSL